MKMLKSAAVRLLRSAGYSLVPYRPEWRFAGVRGAPATLIDIGCAFGTAALYDAFPRAKLFLVDPVREYEPRIEEILRRRPGGYRIAAVGASPGTMTLKVNLDAPTKTSFLERTALTRTGGRYEDRAVAVERLDDLVAAEGLAPPFGIKIDTEGFELDVIRGATETLRRSLFVVAETSVQRRFEGSYTFLDLVSEMDARGFRVGNILSSFADANGLVRFADILYLPKET